MTTLAPSRLDRWRADTPGCAHRIHLNNAGAGLMPATVLAAMREHLELEAMTGGYEAAESRADEVRAAYDALGRLVGTRAANVAIVGSATDGFVRAMGAFDFAPGDVLVTTRCDYTSYQIHYLALARRRGVIVRHADDLPEGGVDPDSVRRILRSSRCRVVHLTWVPTNSGLVQDAESVGAICEEAGVPYLVDACQAAGQLPIDVARLRCDYLTATGRKFLRGPRGIGFLYVSDRALARGDHPLFVDMRGADWSTTDTYTLAADARRFEDWEFAYALVLGLGEAARYALDVGIEVAHERSSALAARLREGLARIPGVRTLDRGREPCAIVTAEIAKRDAREVAEALVRRGINVNATLRLYGQYDFADKGVESALRVSPHYYNTEEEIEAMLAALQEEVAGRT
jgi:selenocysteine lyase/cysteine desulfurase